MICFCELGRWCRRSPNTSINCFRVSTFGLQLYLNVVCIPEIRILQGLTFHRFTLVRPMRIHIPKLLPTCMGPHITAVVLWWKNQPERSTSTVAKSIGKHGKGDQNCTAFSPEQIPCFDTNCPATSINQGNLHGFLGDRLTQATGTGQPSKGLCQCSRRPRNGSWT